MIFEQGTPCFNFAFGTTNYIACLTSTFVGIVMSPWRTVFQNCDFLVLYLEAQRQKVKVRKDHQRVSVLDLDFCSVLHSWQLNEVTS